MNYQYHYDRLIERAKTRTPIGYVEKHHITPKCLGGSNDKENLVALTPEEHFVAHKLLIKLHPGNVKLIYAANKMCHGRENNKLYGWLRRLYSKTVSNKVVSDETRKKFSAIYSGEGNPMYGRPSPCGMKDKKHSTATRQKISQANKAAWTDERRKTLSQRMTGENSPLFGKKPSPQTREIWSSQRSGSKNPMFGKSAVKGRRWMTSSDNQNCLLCPQDQIKDKLAEGWKFGRLK